MTLRMLARRARDGARNAIHEVQLRRGLAVLARTLQSGRTPRLALIEQLVHAWGNEAWCASAAYLSAILDWLPQTSGSIVECGSGISTLLLATAAMLSGRKICSLEHDTAWAAFIEQRTPNRLRSRVSLSVRPLTNYGEFEWYSIDPAATPGSIGFVVCDGPPAATRGGRYGLAPVLGNQLAAGAIILLDDTQRSEERAILERWCTELGATVIQEGETFTALRVGHSVRVMNPVSDPVDEPALRCGEPFA